MIPIEYKCKSPERELLTKKEIKDSFKNSVQAPIRKNLLSTPFKGLKKK